MTLSLIIISALVIAGLALYAHDRATAPDTDRDTPEQPRESDSQCCGMHITCEKDSLLAAVDSVITYYDDEELDTYRGLPADGYSDEATEQFRDVLLTLLPGDIAGWARSLQLRGIALPTPVREELLMIVSEARGNSQSSGHGAGQ